MRAERMFELSPFVTAARAPARRMPASSSVSRSKPNPLRVWPPQPSGRRRKAEARLSMIATVWPSATREIPRPEPTRPLPTITTCTGPIATTGDLLRPTNKADCRPRPRRSYADVVGATGVPDVPESPGYRVKRLLLGPPLVTEQLASERLGKPTALAVL